MPLQLAEVRSELVFDGDKLVGIKREQEITDEFLDHCRDARFDSLNTPAGEFHRVASVPEGLHLKWLREGYDCTKEPVQETLKKLRVENYQQFITTAKSI